MGYSIVEPTLDVDADLVTTHRHIDPPWVRWRPWSVNFHRCFVALNLSVELLLELRGWNVAEVAVKAGGVVPMDTTEGCELDVLNRFPWAAVGRTAE